MAARSCMKAYATTVSDTKQQKSEARKDFTFLLLRYDTVVFYYEYYNMTTFCRLYFCLDLIGAWGSDSSASGSGFAYSMRRRHILCQNRKAGWYEKKSSYFSFEAAISGGVGTSGGIGGDLLCGELSGGTGGLCHRSAVADLLRRLRRKQTLRHIV